MGDISAARLKDLFEYNPKTGKFSRIKFVKGTVVGTIAGVVNGCGYVQIGIDYKVYLAHRLAWLWMTGEWPEDTVDHINNIRTDNRWKNLRRATVAQNVSNSRTPKDSFSGKKGAYLQPNGRWRAGITHNKKYISLGMFDTKEEANAAYYAAAIKFKGEFARAA